MEDIKGTSKQEGRAMSYLISDESGTCAALPLRDSWGARLTVNHWTVPPEPVVQLAPRRVEVWTQQATPARIFSSRWVA